MLAILMRLSRVGNHEKFNPSTAVLMGEFMKLGICFLIIWKQPQHPKKSFEKGETISSRKIIFNQKELLRVSIPAMLYVIQNNLQYVAVSNLNAATFQVLYQLKIFTTAIFSVVLLRKAILPLQWGAIAVLMMGVALVQLDDSSSDKNSTKATDQNMTLGLIAVICSCLCSGFAGVYFEKILKNSTSKATLWERNVQMGLSSIVIAMGGLLWNDREFLQLNGFFYGYRPIVWAAITVSAAGGLLTAVVVKYADNILKAFATSIAIVLSVIISIFLFDKIPTLQFICGALLVNISVYVYGNSPSWKQQHTLPHTVGIKKSIQ
jgi:UDP-galactose transporter